MRRLTFCIKRFAISV
ncbi:hypothetical protein YPPY64_0846, partial [Yersinia pestis PY-64]